MRRIFHGIQTILHNITHLLLGVYLHFARSTLIKQQIKTFKANTSSSWAQSPSKSCHCSRLLFITILYPRRTGLTLYTIEKPNCARPSVLCFLPIYTRAWPQPLTFLAKYGFSSLETRSKPCHFSFKTLSAARLSEKCWEKQSNVGVVNVDFFLAWALLALL